MVLSVVAYGTKNYIFYEKNFKLTKSNTLNINFFNRIFPYYSFLQALKNFLGVHKSLSFFRKYILYNSFVSNFENK